MHMEFKKSSLPNTTNKSKIQFIPSRFLKESKEALCKRVLKLEQENDDLREENLILKRKLSKLATPSPQPSPKKVTCSHGYGHSPWLVPSLGEESRYRITITFIIFTYFSSILSYFVI
jgi:hypothetical protein